MAAKILEKTLTFLFDVVAINVAFVTTFWLRYQSNIFPESFNPHADLSTYTIPLLIMTLGWVTLFFFSGLYRDWYKESRFDEFFVVLRTVVIGVFFLFLVTSAPQMVEFATSGDITILVTRTKFATLLTYATCMLFFATLIRFAMHTLLMVMFARGIARYNVLIVGANDRGEKLVASINRNPRLGYRVAGFIDDDRHKKGTTLGNTPILGAYADIHAVVMREHVSGIIIGEVTNSPNEIMRIIEFCGDSHVTIYMVPSLMDVITGHLKTNQIFGVPLMVLLQDHMPAWEAQVKRIMDIVISAAVLVIGSPVWLATAALIRLTSAGPAVFKQERIGRNGKPFIMRKFRSMYQDAEKRTGPVWAKENDPRITPMGRFIRKTRLDEIPQFINVLMGDMSLVGPRPERQFFIDQLKKEIPWYIRRIKMKPGITGWAQVKHKYDETIEDVKQKVMYDLYYFENMSLALDLKIMLLTLWVVVSGRGAH
jgi:exopolysaccharide biosynthesis polyprenyl glycosylphosphotransferase